MNECMTASAPRPLDIEREPVFVGFGTAVKVLGIPAQQLYDLIASGAIVPANLEPTRFRYADLVAYRKERKPSS